MNVTFDSKGDFDVARAWLKRVSESNPTVALNQIASEGKGRLASNTPKDTGETAASWQANISTEGNVTEIAWTNTAHQGTRVNVAKLIELGHGTGTGGYVPPDPYIKKSMDPVFKTAGDKLVKELIK